MNIEKKVFQLIISAMFFVVPVYGQHSELLSQYRNRALQYNQDMKAAEKNIALSKELEKSAKTEYKPKLSAGANFNYTGNPMELSLDLPSLDNPLQFEGRHMKYGASVSLAQPLYTGGRIREGVKKAEAESRLALNQSEMIKSDISYEADLRYWSTVARNEMVKVTRRFTGAVEELTKVIRERVEVQLVDRNDLLMAEVKLNDARYQLMQAENNYEVARMSLNSFIGVDYDLVIPIDTLVSPIHEVGSLPAYMDQAGNNRPELRMAQDKISIQESAHKLNQSQFLPQFYVGVDGSYSSPGYNFKADLDPNYAVYAKVSIPLFEWGKRRNEKRAGEYRVAIARENFSKVKDVVSLEVQSAYYNYVQAVERVTLTENSLIKAQENEAMALERYREGKMSVDGVLDAQMFHQTAQMNFVQSRLTAQISYSAFVRALGLLSI